MQKAGDSLFRQAHCAEQYDVDRFGGGFGRFLEEREIELFSDLARGQAEVLDAGAGTGKLALAMLRQGRKVTAADFSHEMLKVAREKAVDSALPGRFAVTDAQALCFKDEAFEGVVSSRMLMHLSDWRAAVAELCRVSRSAVILDFPPRLSAAGIDAGLKHLIPKRRNEFRTPYHTFYVGQLTTELTKQGFAVTDVRRGYLLPVAWHRRLDRPAWSARIEAIIAATGLTRLFGAPVTVRAVRQPTPRGAPMPVGHHAKRLVQKSPGLGTQAALRSARRETPDRS